ncbi:hypothetical protein [Mesorhizobium opportunistum]|uniref:hypothetical protein n=1 Tax=Mesorhizobium opportunistum TaxID=593909 RepID=UPI001FD8BA7F|nr:hypothetical protein [Mesorhizobium opportunistum]
MTFAEPVPSDWVAWAGPAPPFCPAGVACSAGAAIAAGSSTSVTLPFDWQPDNVRASAKAIADVRAQ